MSQTDDNTETLQWPIAPDGYIPNSVIRCWRWKGKDLMKTDCWDDILFDSLHWVNECQSDDEEDVSTRVFWFTQDEEEEEEEDNTDDVKGRKKKMEDEKKEKDRKKKIEMEEKEKTDEKKEKEEHKMDRTVLLEQTYDIQTTLQNQLKTCDGGRMKVKPQTTSGPTSCHKNGPKQLSKQREHIKLHETITPPLQCLSRSCKQTASSFIPTEWLKPLVESPVGSADAVILKQKPRITSDTPPKRTSNLTHAPKAPPSTPEDPQPQPDLGPPECSPIRDKRLLLSPTTNNIRDQAQVTCEQKVLELFKKLKNSKRNSPHFGKCSTTTENHPAYTNTFIQPELPCQPLYSEEPTQLANTILPTTDQSYKSMPEGRKNMHTAKLATREDWVQSSDARQLVETVPLLQHGQAAAPLRVVRKIQMTDTSEPASSHLHHIIPMASQQSFFTLDPCGTTQYGRLQFDWVRGHDEGEQLSVSGVKI